MSLVKVPIYGAEPYGFKATDISGCRVWLDASDVSTTYALLPQTGVPGYTDYTSANAQQVTVWADKSIGGNDFIKNVDPANIQDTSQIYIGPTIVAPDSYLTPMAVLNFDQGNNTGSGDAGGASNEPRFLQQNLVAVGGYTGFTSAAGPRIGTGISATTDIFVVVRPKFLTVAGDVFSIGSRPGETADFTSLSITNNGYWKIRSQAGARDVTSSIAESFGSFSNVTGEDSGYRILHMSLSNNNYVLRRMGSVVGSNASHTWSPTLANYRYYIGRANNAASAGNYFNGKIGEICVYNNIITTEKRLIIESFMAKRWNLVDLLPLDHPARLTNIPIFLRGMSLAGDPNEYTNRGSIRKVFVLGPDATTISTHLIGNTGTTLTTIWIVAGTGGTLDYYNITVFNSTDDITFSVAQYIARYASNSTSFLYTIGSVDNKYYRTQVEARNLGGGATTITTSILNSIPGNPTVNDLSKTANSTIFISWSAGESGGVSLTYNIILYRSNNNFVSNSVAIYTENGSDELDTTVEDSAASEGFTDVNKYRASVTAINGSGSSSTILSAIFTYPADGS
jgi:hypothetical protein